MKTFNSLFVIGLLACASVSADAQISRKDYPSNNTSASQSAPAPATRSSSPSRSSSSTTTTPSRSNTSSSSTTASRSSSSSTATRPAPAPTVTSPSRASDTYSRERSSTAPRPAPSVDRSPSRANTQSRNTGSPATDENDAPRSGTRTPVPYCPPGGNSGGTTRPATTPTRVPNTTTPRRVSTTTSRSVYVGSPVSTSSSTRLLYSGRLNRAERRALQDRLIRREERLDDWAYELDQRGVDLYGRDYSRCDYPRPRYDYRNYLLSERELCDWSDALDDEAAYLAEREQQLLNADRRDRRYNSRNNRSRRDRSGWNNGNSSNNGRSSGGNSSSGGGMCPPGW